MEVYSVKIWTPITEKYDEGNMVETHETSLSIYVKNGWILLNVNK